MEAINNIPQATFFCGVNGAGKTTVYYQKTPKDKIKYGVRINSDEFVISFGDWKNSKEQFRAVKMALALREECIKNNLNFNQETTLCGMSIIRIIKNLSAKKWRIVIYFVGLDSVDLAKKRVALRVAKGGHNIDSTLIEKRFSQSIKNLKHIIPFCNEIHIYDNSLSLEKVAEIIEQKINIKRELPQWLSSLVIKPKTSNKQISLKQENKQDT